MAERGRPIRLGLSSADVSTAAAIGLYDMDGAAVTLQSNERVVIYVLNVYSVTNAGLVTVFTDNDDGNDIDDGERIFVTSATGVGGVNSEVAEYAPIGQVCARGIPPHVKAAGAGAVVVTGVATIIEDRTETLGNHPSWDTRS